MIHESKITRNGRRFMYGIFTVLILLLGTSVATGQRLADVRQTSAAAGWSCNPVNGDGARVAWKANGFAGSLAGLAQQAPADTTFFVVQNVRDRTWSVFMYPGDLVAVYPFDHVIYDVLPPSGGFQTGRVNPVGDPVAVYHDGRIKLWYTQWPGDGGGDTQLVRVDFGCSYRAEQRTVTG